MYITMLTETASKNFQYGFCFSIVNLILLYNYVSMMTTHTAMTYTFTLTYTYLSMYFSLICGLITLFLASSNYIAPSINLEEDCAIDEEDEVEDGEIVEEFTHRSLPESQEDEEEDTLGDLPTYDEDIYNTMDYSESEKET